MAKSDASRGTSSPASGLWRASDGADIYFEDSGSAAPVLFYIYGLACSIRHWKYPLAHFADGGPAAMRGKPHRQVWLDFRGHGHSGRPAARGPLKVTRIIDDIVELCAFRGIKSATFLGQSMGGSIVLDLAHRHPTLVDAVVLLATPGRDPGRSLPLQPVSQRLWRLMIEVNKAAPDVVRLGFKLSEPFRGVVRVAMREIVRNLGFNPKLSRTDDIDEYVNKVLDIDPNDFYDMAGELASFDVATLQPAVTQPALVIAGEMDRVVPVAEAERLASHLPNAELQIVPHGSHCPHFDDPGRVNELIESFLRRHSL